MLRPYSVLAATLPRVGLRLFATLHTYVEFSRLPKRFRRLTGCFCVLHRFDTGVCVAGTAAGAPHVPHRHAPDRIGDPDPQARPGEAVEDRAQRR